MGSIVSALSNNTEEEEVAGFHHPSPADVLEVRLFLTHYLPLELADEILEAAEYWPRVAACQRAHLDIDYSEWCYLVAPPLPEGSHVKKIVFFTRSNDQGWSSDPPNQGSYRGSWTWFEAAIIRPRAISEFLEYIATHGPRKIVRPDHAEYPTTWEVQVGESRTRWDVQRNLHASSTIREYTVVWTGEPLSGVEDFDPERGCGLGNEFLAALQPGDRIVLIARAMYPGWVNHVYEAQVEIFYTVKPPAEPLTPV